MAQVVYFAETVEAQGIGLFKLAQRAINDGRMCDAETDQLEQLDEWTQQLSDAELAWMLSWGPVA